MKYNAKFTKIEDGYYRAKINNVELWEVDELLVWTIKEREKEIERLNNIIDKLEIDIEIGTGNYTYDTDYNRGLKDAFIYMNDRLQELKGSDK